MVHPRECGPRPPIIDVHTHPSMQLYHDLIGAFAAMNTAQRFPERVAFPPDFRSGPSKTPSKPWGETASWPKSFHCPM